MKRQFIDNQLKIIHVDLAELVGEKIPQLLERKVLAKKAKDEAKNVVPKQQLTD